jgi:methionine-rich copper-binding protein CopC
MKSAIATAFVLTLLAAVPAFGHSQLATSVPANHAVLEQSPSELVLNFKSAVQVTAARLFSADGTEIDLQKPDTSSGSDLYQTPIPLLAAGEYVLEWRALSADGHDIGGKIAFTLRGK